MKDPKEDVYNNGDLSEYKIIIATNADRRNH